MSVKFRFLTKKHGMILLFVMLTALMLISLVGAIGVLSKRNLNDVVNQVDSKRAKYNILTFGGKGFIQQVVITWEEEDEYAEQIVDRILGSLDVKTQV